MPHFEFPQNLGRPISHRGLSGFTGTLKNPKLHGKSGSKYLDQELTQKYLGQKTGAFLEILFSEMFVFYVPRTETVRISVIID